MDIKKALKNFPLRIALTDYCNLNCFFCSNEGMSYLKKNTTHVNFRNLKYLLKILKEKGLVGVSFTGGEPSLYPSVQDVLDYVNELGYERVYFHTNGTSLTKPLIDNQLSRIAKVAVSIHTVNFDTWQKITRGSKDQFLNIMKNIKSLRKYSENGNLLVEIKIVPLKNINDSKKEIGNFLDFCAKNKFKFKFLNFEPITKNHLKYRVGIKNIINKVEDIGAKELKNDQIFRGQKGYLPLNWFKYKGTKGVIIEIGCGDPKVCRSCFDCNEIFLTPDLAIKPCHMSSKQIKLSSFMENKNKEAIFDAILDSRKFLKEMPGENKKYWQQKDNEQK